MFLMYIYITTHLSFLTPKVKFVRLNATQKNPNIATIPGMTPHWISFFPRTYDTTARITATIKMI